MNKPKILVHVCCAPDALYVLTLLKEVYEVYAYFYNPNIHPQKEYELRLEETRKVTQILDAVLIEGNYDDNLWFKITQKFKHEPEKERRCDVCYALRLEQTARKASELGFDSFATVMSLSPWKKAKVLNRLGNMLAKKHRINFLVADFKKKDGFKKSIEMSKRHKLYRQNYCGCIYSQSPPID
jgi:predicted adenine nucleotide alpha hydrolase (AANH) superfamily ATPase